MMKYFIAALLLMIGGAASAQTVILQPSGQPAIGLIPVVTTTLTPGLIIKAGPGNLYAVVATGQTAGFLMTFNATSIPADGAVAPIDCVQLPANSTVSINFSPNPPQVFTTGIVAVLSSTGCLTKTAINALLLKALVQ